MNKAITMNNRLVKIIEVIKYLTPSEKIFIKEYLEKEKTWEQKFNRMLKDARESFRKHLISSGYNPDKLSDKDIERIIDEIQSSN